MFRSDYAIAVDTGGTFTDVTLADLVSGRFWQVKIPTTPDDQSRGFVEGVRRVMALAGMPAGAIGGVFHGTTVATNAILERKGARVGMLTTDGCRHVLHIGRQSVPKDAQMLTWVKPEQLAPPRRIFEIPERLGSDGKIVRELDETACRQALQALGKAGIESLAICFLHAYVNPVHERRAAELAAAELPGIPASSSHEVLPVFREYERTMATTVNAYVQPKIGNYLRRLEERLGELGIVGPLRIMKSNGGMYSARESAVLPIHTVLSGPAATVIGAVLVGKAAGQPNVISIDIGGTSADICLSNNGEPAITSEGEVGGMPFTVPMLGVHTIGAGGGSIARISADGSLLVGPFSAGAEPGPACYGRGGTQPTVTDAHLAMGRIPCELAGGEVRLDAALAARAVEEHVARPLGLSLMQAADGIVEILDNNMAAAIRAVSVEKGYDPREFSLVVGGGAGALHGGRLAELLGIPRIIVPAAAGLLSTLGLLSTDLKNDYLQTMVQRLTDADPAKLAAGFEKLEAEATAWLERERIPPEDRRLVRAADMRYANQGYEIAVVLPGGPVDDSLLPELVRRFHAEHQKLYDWSAPALSVELVALRVSAYGRLPKLTLPRAGAGGNKDASPGSRPVYFGRRHGVAQTPVYHFADLQPGWRATGPAVVEQRFSTVLILPGHEARFDEFGNILIEVPR